MVSRKGNQMDKQYPELFILPHHLKAKSALVDGEIAALDERGIPSFELLQRRINVTEASAIATLARHVPVVFFAFDLLYLDGYDLAEACRSSRANACLRRSSIRTRPSDTQSISKARRQSCWRLPRSRGTEGDSIWRGEQLLWNQWLLDWVKYKVVDTDSFAICGFTKGERDHFRALVLGIYEGKTLKWGGQRRNGLRQCYYCDDHLEGLRWRSKRMPGRPG